MGNNVQVKMSKDALPAVARVYCQDCQKLIIKKRNQSWGDYIGRKFCNRACLARNQSRLQIDAKSQLKLPDGTIMPLGNYIKKHTENLRDTVDYYIGVVKHMKRLSADVESAGRYKGIEVTGDLVKEANRFLLENSDGKPGQRKPPEDVDNRRESELVTELRFILKELGYDMVRREEAG